MTATSTKNAPKRDSIARAMDEGHAEFHAEQQMIAEVEERHRGVELTPGNLQMSMSETHYFARHLDAENVFMVLRILAGQRGIRELRERCGDPQKLADVRAAQAAAVEALDGNEGEQIRQQVQQLESQLTALNRARAVADREVARLEKMRKGLRSLAPAPLLQQVENDLREFQGRSPVWQRLAKVNGEVRALEERAAQVASLRSEIEWIEGQHDHIRARYTKRLGELTTEAGALEVAVAASGLPALRAERQQLEAEWQSLVGQVEAPLDRWAAGDEL